MPKRNGNCNEFRHRNGNNNTSSRGIKRRNGSCKRRNGMCRRDGSCHFM